MDDVSNNDTVISALKQQTLDQLKPRLSLVIEETADYLFSLSTSTRLDPAVIDNIEHTGIDFIERESDVLLSTSELLSRLGSELL